MLGLDMVAQGLRGDPSWQTPASRLCESETTCLNLLMIYLLSQLQLSPQSLKYSISPTQIHFPNSKLVFLNVC